MKIGLTKYGRKLFNGEDIPKNAVIGKVIEGKPPMPYTESPKEWLNKRNKDNNEEFVAFIPRKYQEMFELISDCNNEMMVFKKIFNDLSDAMRVGLFHRTFGVRNAHDPDLIYHTLIYLYKKISSNNQIIFIDD